MKIGELAAQLQVDPNTVRNWCRRYARYLSPGANPASGSVRVLNQRDANVLRYVQIALNEGMNHAELARVLTEKSFSDGESDVIVGLAEVVSQEDAPEVPPTPQEAQDGASVLSTVLSSVDKRVDGLQSQIEAIQRAQNVLLKDALERGRVQGGIIMAIVAVLMWVALWLLVFGVPWS